MELEIGCRYKKIEGYDCYYITENGDVYSYRDENDKKGWKGLRKLSPHCKNVKNKYNSVTLCKDGIFKEFLIHRLVAKYFCDGYFEGAVVNHKDCNIKNNNYKNLEWITQKENIHKSYIDSGMNQTRNYKIYKLYCLDEFLCEFIGAPEIEKYIRENKLDCSYTSLRKYRKSRNYRIIVEQKKHI